MSFSAYLIIALRFSSLAGAAEIPPDDKVIKLLNAGAARGTLSQEIRLLDWNVKKGENGEPLAVDFPEFANGRNLVTIQEGYESPFLTGILAKTPGFSFYLTSAFVYRGTMTGVITGSSVEPTRMEFRRSPGLEPILNSPKMTGLSYFTLDGGQELLLANLHGLNFVDVAKFETQIKDVMAVLAKHEGPIVLAGDFNTWAEARMKVLHDETSRIGLDEVPVQRSGNGQSADLDHVFQKGCVVEKAWVVENVKSSDHDPLFVDLRCGTP